MQKLPVVNKTLLEKQEHIVQVYTDILNSFSFSIFLSQNNPGVLIVGSSSDLVKFDGEVIEDFLDFRIEGLIEINMRDIGFVGEGENMKIGTSISAPLVLASFVNKDGLENFNVNRPKCLYHPLKF